MVLIQGLSAELYDGYAHAETLFAAQDRYELLRKIGEGGSAEVFLALDTVRQVFVAVKVAKRAMDECDSEMEEAGLLKRLSHPAIPEWVDSFTVSGQSFLVMEYKEGETLDQAMKKGRIRSFREVLVVAQAVAEVLQYLHSLDPPVLYLDLKPANLIVPEAKKSTLGRTQDIFLIDFDTAAACRTGQETDHVCRMDFDPNAMNRSHMKRGYGTPEFAAPEQFEGKPEIRSDLYAFGKLLMALISVVETAKKSEAAEFYEKANPASWDEVREANKKDSKAQEKDTEKPGKKGRNRVESDAEERAEKVLKTVAERCVRQIPAERYAALDEILFLFSDFRDAEIRGKKRQSRVAFFRRGSRVLIGMLLFLGGCAAVYTASARVSLERTWERDVRGTEAEQWAEAVFLFPNRPEPYEKLVNYYLEYGISAKESAELKALLDAAALSAWKSAEEPKKDGTEDAARWARIFYDAGKLFLCGLREVPLAERAGLARTLFQKAADCPSFRKEACAKRFCDVSTYYERGETTLLQGIEVASSAEVEDEKTLCAFLIRILSENGRQLADAGITKNTVRVSMESLRAILQAEGETTAVEEEVTDEVREHFETYWLLLEAYYDAAAEEFPGGQ